MFVFQYSTHPQKWLKWNRKKIQSFQFNRYLTNLNKINKFSFKWLWSIYPWTTICSIRKFVDLKIAKVIVERFVSSHCIGVFYLFRQCIIKCKLLLKKHKTNILLRCLHLTITTEIILFILTAILQAIQFVLLNFIIKYAMCLLYFKYDFF